MKYKTIVESKIGLKASFISDKRSNPESFFFCLGSFLLETNLVEMVLQWVLSNLLQKTEMSANVYNIVFEPTLDNPNLEWR